MASERLGELRLDADDLPVPDRKAVQVRSASAVKDPLLRLQLERSFEPADAIDHELCLTSEPRSERVDGQCRGAMCGVRVRSRAIGARLKLVSITAPQLVVHLGDLLHRQRSDEVLLEPLGSAGVVNQRRAVGRQELRQAIDQCLASSGLHRQSRDIGTSSHRAHNRARVWRADLSRAGSSSRTVAAAPGAIIDRAMSFTLVVRGIADIDLGTTIDVLTAFATFGRLEPGLEFPVPPRPRRHTRGTDRARRPPTRPERRARLPRPTRLGSGRRSPGRAPPDPRAPRGSPVMATQWIWIKPQAKWRTAAASRDMERGGTADNTRRLMG